MERNDAIERSLEDRESDVEQIETCQEDIEQRQAGLNQALMALEKDELLLQSLEKNKSGLEEERRALEARRMDAVQQLEQIEAELNMVSRISDQSQEVLDVLAVMGEDVAEAGGILRSRRAWLEECRQRVAELARRLGGGYEAEGALLGAGQPLSEQPEVPEKEIPPTPADDRYHWEEDEAFSPEDGMPALDRETAEKKLQAYMWAHNYGRADFRHYSQDPVWQYLDHIAYPDDLTPLSIWAKKINPNFHNRGQDQKKFQENCGACAFVMEQHLNGTDLTLTASVQNLGTDRDMEIATGKRCTYMEPDDIERFLMHQGAGAHLIAGINRRNPVTGRPAAGHWFNLYYDGKKVYTIDSQCGEIFEWPHDYGNVSGWCILI